jgi:hypothetical protein
MATLDVRSRSVGVRSTERERLNHAGSANEGEPLRSLPSDRTQEVGGSSPPSSMALMNEPSPFWGSLVSSDGR